MRRYSVETNTTKSDFERLGFLGLESDSNAIDFWNENSDWHQLVLDLCVLAASAFRQVEVRNRDPQRILAYTVFYRLLTAFQATALLTARGMDVEAKTMLRTMTEAIIVLVATSKSQSFAVRFIRTDEDTPRKLLAKTLAAESEAKPGEKLYLSPLQISEMRTELESLEHKKKSGGLEKEISKEDIAREADLLNLYRKHFSYFSLFTHLTPSGMRQFLITNQKGEISHFRMGIFYDDALANIRSAISLLFIGLSATKDLFSLKIEPGMTLTTQRFESLIAQVENENQTEGTKQAQGK